MNLMATGPGSDFGVVSRLRFCLALSLTEPGLEGISRQLD